MSKQKKFDWEKTAEKKIFEYVIKYIEKSHDEESKNCDFINLILDEISRNKPAYRINDEKYHKYYAIETITKTNNFYEIILKNCKYNYTPNILNVQTQEEHKSLKTMDEGDKEQTHILINGYHMLYESKRNGTPLKIFNTFINSALYQLLKKINIKAIHISFEQVLDKNFIEALKKASKVRSLKFKVKSNLIGSQYFNFNNDNGVDDNYYLEIKAKRKNKFDKFNLISKIESLLADDKKIEKITVDMDDENHIHRVINTEEFAKFYIVYVDKKPTGEILSSDMFLKMKGLFNE